MATQPQATPEGSSSLLFSMHSASTQACPPGAQFQAPLPLLPATATCTPRPAVICCPLPLPGLSPQSWLSPGGWRMGAWSSWPQVGGLRTFSSERAPSPSLPLSSLTEDPSEHPAWPPLTSVSTRRVTGDCPGGPVAKTLISQCWGPGFDPWLGK